MKIKDAILIFCTVIVCTPPSHQASAQEPTQIQALQLLSERRISYEEFQALLAQSDSTFASSKNFSAGYINSNYPNTVTQGNYPSAVTQGNVADVVTQGSFPNTVTQGNFPSPLGTETRPFPMPQINGDLSQTEN